MTQQYNARKDIPRTPPVKTEQRQRVKLPAKFRKKTPKTYNPNRATTRKNFDEQLLHMVDQQKFVRKNFLAATMPECPECHKSDVQEKGIRESFCVGTKEVYRCLNPDCPRKTFTLDDDRFRNMALKAVTYEALYFSKGDKDTARLSQAMLKNYAYAAENMPIYAHLKDLIDH
jgi:hypothetical protein